MVGTPEDLEKLLIEVRKTIIDNQNFLRGLADESVDDENEKEVEENFKVELEQFEEL